MIDYEECIETYPDNSMIRFELTSIRRKSKIVTIYICDLWIGKIFWYIIYKLGIDNRNITMISSEELNNYINKKKIMFV